MNDLLNSGKLPELHLPGYNYCGPGTKLTERLERGDKPVNKLDSACRAHDMTYHIVKQPKQRHLYDKELENKAFKIMYSPEASLREKAEAGLVGTVMNLKQKLGMGRRRKV